MTIEEVIHKIHSVKTLADWEEASREFDAYEVKNDNERQILMGYGEMLYMLRAGVEAREQKRLAKAS